MELSGQCLCGKIHIYIPSEIYMKDKPAFYHFQEKTRQKTTNIFSEDYQAD